MKARALRGNRGTATAYDRFYAYDETCRTAVIDDFSGGVATDEFSVRENTVATAMNLETAGKMLRTVCAPRQATIEGGFAAGEITASARADGKWLFRKGNTLYLRQNDAFSVVGTVGMLTSDKTAIFPVDERFFIVDGTRVLEVSDTATPAEPEAYIPLCFTDVSADGTTRTVNEPPNPFCRYFEIKLSNEANSFRKIPEDFVIDPTYIHVWNPRTGESIPTIDYSFDGVNIHFWSHEAKGYHVRLRLLDSDDPTKFSYTSISQMRELAALNIRPIEPVGARWCYLAHGGSDGREIFIWRMNALSDFAYLSEDKLTSYEYSERISAIVAYSDGYLIFSEGAIRKLFLTVDETGALSFDIQEFKSDFGSDMPGSICGFDDKIIFANSRGGVFYINKFGITERDASRRISANIEEGEQGFFSHSEEEYHAACAACALGRYFLTVGDVTYVWDYGAGLPSATQSRENETRMVWTMFDMAKPSAYFAEISRRLYFTERGSGTLCYMEAAHESDAGGEGGISRVRTAASDLGVTEEKVPVSVSVRYRAADTVILKIWYDGAAAPCEYRLPPAKDFVTVKIKPYAKRFIRCAAQLESKGEMTLAAVGFTYRAAKP